MSNSQTNFKRFSPIGYIKEYYDNLITENEPLLIFYDKAYKIIFSPNSRQAKLLEFSGGPTIYQLISASKYNVLIDFSDFLESNLLEVKKWTTNDKSAYNWDKYFEKVLSIEKTRVSKDSVNSRKYLLRKKIVDFFRCNAKVGRPLGKHNSKKYDIVSANFVPESITKYKKTWKNSIKRILSLVKDDGYFINTSIIGARSYNYKVGSLFFPAFKVSKDEIKAELMLNGFKPIFDDVAIVDEEFREKEGFEGMYMILAKKLT